MEETNLLYEDILNEFKSVHLPETDILSEGILTTCTAQGLFENVEFHEKDLTQKLKLKYPIGEAYSNYGRVITPGYVPYEVPKLNNRGRKKKEKPKSTRKIQGDGTCFNTQITFSVETDFIDITSPSKLVSSDKIKNMIKNNVERKPLKFKVFRTGKIQLPGVKQNIVDKIIIATHIIGKQLDVILKSNVKLLYLKPDMKNYKFVVKNMVEPQIINFEYLLSRIKYSKFVFEPGISIISVSQHANSTKLTIIFLTPNEKSQTDTITVIIVLRGKINILGSYLTKHAQNIYAFLNYIFDDPKLIVNELT